MMHYDCGHEGCDICGVRPCDSPESSIEPYGDFVCCKRCVRRAIRFAYDASATFGGTIIDVHKHCGVRTVCVLKRTPQ